MKSRPIQEDPASRIGLVEEDPREILTYRCRAILRKGLMVFGYENEDKVGDGHEGKVVETSTRTDATMKGIIHKFNYENDRTINIAPTSRVNCDSIQFGCTFVFKPRSVKICF